MLRVEKFSEFSLLIFDSREVVRVCVCVCYAGLAAGVRFSSTYWIVIDSSVISIYT